MIFSSNQHFKIPIQDPAVDGIVNPINNCFTADYKSIEITLSFDGASDYDVTLFGSNSVPVAPAMPDPTLPPSPENQCFDVAFIDESQNLYNAATPYNPGAPGVAGSKTFHVQVEGLRWLFINIDNAAGGSALFTIDLFSDN